MFQDLTRIDQAIARDELAGNVPLNTLLDACTGGGRTLHLVGLLSDGGLRLAVTASRSQWISRTRSRSLPAAGASA